LGEQQDGTWVSSMTAWRPKWAVVVVTLRESSLTIGPPDRGDP
jgi:hypothetical protein